MSTSKFVRRRTAKPTIFTKFARKLALMKVGSRNAGIRRPANNDYCSSTVSSRLNQ